MKRNRTLCFSSYKNRKLTVKLWWVGACERKKSTLFVSFILSEENFLNICFVSMYSVLITLPEYTYFYIWKKHYFINFCCLLLKPSKAFSVSLMNHNHAPKTEGRKNQRATTWGKFGMCHEATNEWIHVWFKYRVFKCRFFPRILQRRSI